MSCQPTSKTASPASFTHIHPISDGLRDGDGKVDWARIWMSVGREAVESVNPVRGR
ncbi:hypothetical protein QJS10_CPB04g00864 [Acorus calamus]|uniref:Uncharacterized protein n=1 Tax=Acorus calamus TaxID=4465 RepID=A0AAV9F1D0_ACOCL|nr:hypothetical protein QJS10_CPB04g00864 [Acorus calamus]